MAEGTGKYPEFWENITRENKSRDIQQILINL